MKNDLHLAYRTTQNFPLQISSLDSVRAHVADDVRLISMLPGEWPKVRGRDIVRKQYTEENTYTIGKHSVQHVKFEQSELSCSGRLIDGKYFFTDSVLNHSMDLELIFTPFADLDVIPMVRREWSWDYPSSNVFWYTLVPTGTKEYQGVEKYHHILGYETLGIHCLADLLAYSYKFRWNAADEQFEAITDPHEISRRIRKPWMQFLVQWRFGEMPGTEADLSKLVSFLLTKVSLTADEEKAVSNIKSRIVTLDDLNRINERHAILNQILEAYHSDFILDVGSKFEDDPLFAIY
ncbi:hypothetical protein pEaSNUABM6_00176 [Erwinia phage pEa_SNUABM_6]|nr:hypothetical protein pEaSNUABM6_00176 [Erwinia phage pEa_SNUABM_6]